MSLPLPPPIPVETLLLAYRSGIFPMAEERDDPEVMWIEPRMRAILPLEGFRCSSSLRKAIRQDRFRVTVDAAFAQVIRACSGPREDNDGCWISHRIEASYTALHHAGHAHSVECWRGDTLVGGLYGVAFDRVFCGESMFTYTDNASKVALAWLVALMRRAGYQVLDCQFMTGHLASLGAVEIPQARYLDLIAAARGEPALTLPRAYASVSAAAGAGLGVGAGAADGAGVAAPAGRDDGVAAGASSPGKLIAQSFTQTS
ncbi:MAG: leucyl/phenylalanyl-tRNA--protein transferase [Sphingomonadaceae bacterium]|nr:leucyl/phenylalanyl-tRNA--protein transferase [Sphingomonadaceae bacterium]